MKWVHFVSPIGRFLEVQEPFCKKVPANRLHKSKFTNTLNKNNAGAAPALF